MLLAHLPTHVQTSMVQHNLPLLLPLLLLLLLQRRLLLSCWS
jgi:hypothetical protein